MFQLPKGNPLFENLVASRLRLPDVVTKLANGSFTGYASFTFPDTTSILVFEAGKLISVTQESSNAKKLSGHEAMTNLAELMITCGSGVMDVYRLSRDLTVSIYSLMQGEVLYRSQELALIDIKTLLERVKNEAMNGCLRIYTDNRSAMIFYKDGNPLGFFHDGSQDIESSAGESQQIASLPGAKLDLYRSGSAEDLMANDLLDVLNISRIWETAVSRQQSVLDKITKEREEKSKMQSSNILADLENQIRNIYIEAVGNVGRGIIDKELTSCGGSSCLLDPERAAKFIEGLERAAKLLINVKKIVVIKEKITSLIETTRA